MAAGEFQVLAKAPSPKDADLSGLVAATSGWEGKVDGIVVGDNPYGRLGVSALVAAQRLKDEGWSVIMTIACRDRNRLALGSTALAAAAIGVDSVLCVSGDYFTFGDHRDAKPVFDFDSVQLLGMLKDMSQGRDAAGNNLGKPISFHAGAALRTTDDYHLPHIMKAKKKVAAGAEFLITLPVFSVEQVRSFLTEANNLAANIIAGVLLPFKQEIDRYTDGSIPGTIIPADLVNRWQSEDDEAFTASSIAHVKELIGRLRDSERIAGVCVSAPGREADIEQLL